MEKVFFWVKKRHRNFYDYDKQKEDKKSFGWKWFLTKTGWKCWWKKDSSIELEYYVICICIINFVITFMNDSFFCCMIIAKTQIWIKICMIFTYILLKIYQIFLLKYFRYIKTDFFPFSFKDTKLIKLLIFAANVNSINAEIRNIFALIEDFC